MIAATLLGLVLVFGLPAHALWPRRRNIAKRSLSKRLALTTIEIAALLAVLVLMAPVIGLTFADIGLAWPPSSAGEIGLVIAALVIGGLAAAILLMKPSKSPREQAALAELPRGRREMTLYLLFALAAGAGWEILYRGFLLWWLEPLVGLVGAVAVASIAYGLAHGWKSRGQGLGSIGSALLFTIGFALTDSLWWLIAIHIAAPLAALLAGWRARANRMEVLPA